MPTSISKDDFLNFQQKWGESIVHIGKLYLEKEDYKQAAYELVNYLYGYNEGNVLFKPTRAQHKQFRLNAQSAIAYFIGNDTKYSEDTGFALQPWTQVRFENEGFIFNKDSALSMGNYFFTDMKGKEKQVEYTIGIFRSENGSLKINIHHSSLPYLHPKH